MIEYIRGEVAELNPAEAIIEAAGVGYQLHISLNTYSAIQGKKEAKLYVYEVIREDTHELFGFAAKNERELFLLLIGISGIGGSTARMLLSAFTPAELVGLIQREDARMIKSVKGIGPKAAQRIIVELHDKVQTLQGSGGEGLSQGIGADAGEVAAKALGALTTLGFPQAAVQKCVSSILSKTPTLTVEETIKQALKML